MRPATFPGAYHHLTCDLGDAEAIAACITERAGLTGHLDHLVNVAGIDPKHRIDDAWHRVVDLDLRAYHLLIHHAIGLLRAGHGRSIVNVSSINYRLGVPGRTLDTVAKNGVLGLNRGLARELGAECIRINSVSPGWVYTERQVREYFSGEEAAKHVDYLHKVKALTHHITPEDIAAHIRFSCSDASLASTGHTCVVDAGWLLE